MDIGIRLRHEVSFLVWKPDIPMSLFRPYSEGEFLVVEFRVEFIPVLSQQ